MVGQVDDQLVTVIILGDIAFDGIHRWLLVRCGLARTEAARSGLIHGRPENPLTADTIRRQLVAMSGTAHESTMLDEARAALRLAEADPGRSVALATTLTRRALDVRDLAAASV